MDKYINKKIIYVVSNQNNSFIKYIEILSEMNRVDIERSNLYFENNQKLEAQK